MCTMFQKGSTKRKKRKDCSFQEALAELDVAPVGSRRKPSIVSFFEQKKDPPSGRYITKPRKLYPRKKAEPVSNIDGMEFSILSKKFETIA